MACKTVISRSKGNNHSIDPTLISPDGQLLAQIKGKNLFIMSVQTQNIREKFMCRESIERVEWSANSKLVMCKMYKKSLVQVFCIHEPHCMKKISEEAAGFTTAFFTPDSNNILACLCYGMMMCIYPMDKKSKLCFPGARILANCRPGYSFSPDGKLLVVAERQREQLVIYSCISWITLKRIQCTDVRGMSWSPDSMFVAVWCDKYELKLQIFLLNGQCVYSEDNNDIAVRNAVWSPCGKTLAISKCHSKGLKLLNCLTWSLIVELEFDRALLEAGIQNIIQHVCFADVEEVNYPLSIMSFICKNSKFPGPDNGLLTFSLCGQFLSVAEGHAVWIWNCGRLISHIDHVKCISNLAWDEHGHLLIWTGEYEVVKWNCQNRTLSKYSIRSGIET